jgi:hypothetical protein
MLGAGRSIADPVVSVVAGAGQLSSETVRGTGWNSDCLAAAAHVLDAAASGEWPLLSQVHSQNGELPTRSRRPGKGANPVSPDDQSALQSGQFRVSYRTIDDGV